MLSFQFIRSLTGLGNPEVENKKNTYFSSCSLFDLHVFFTTVVILSILVADNLFFPNPISSDNTRSKKFTSKEVPELNLILSGDQDTRLKAGRKLVERVGVEDALEILEHSDLPHTGEGHLIVHQIGFYAYQKYGLDSILHCKDYFLHACFHGAIIEAASDGGFEEVAKMTERCSFSRSRFYQCVHAAGHGILAIWNYDLPEALKTCDQLFEKDSQYSDTSVSCHNGAFMENIYGVHDWGKGKKTTRVWISDTDPYFPCNAFGEKYQTGCWLSQAARIYQLHKGDISLTAKDCKRIGNVKYVNLCMDDLARQIHGVSGGDITKVFGYCSNVGEGWIEFCIGVNAGSYYSIGDFNTSIQICNRLESLDDNKCLGYIEKLVISDVISRDEKRIRCKQLGGNVGKHCLSQI